MSILIHYKNLKKLASSGSDECDVFMAAALDTWYRIRFSRTKPGFKIHETTLTQNLIYELNLFSDSRFGKARV